jgi:hypothetical protein
MTSNGIMSRRAAHPLLAHVAFLVHVAHLAFQVHLALLAFKTSSTCGSITAIVRGKSAQLRHPARRNWRIHSHPDWPTTRQSG